MDEDDWRALSEIFEQWVIYLCPQEMHRQKSLHHQRIRLAFAQPPVCLHIEVG